MEDEDTEKDLQKINAIYEGDLDFNTIKSNPVLKPIAEINETFVNLELMINKSLIEYQEIEELINKMIEDNPVYSETILMSKIESLKNNVKQIIHSQDLQKTNMKTKINEMIRIVEEEYEPRGEEEIISSPEKVSSPKIKEKIEEPEESENDGDVIEKLKKMTGEEESKDKYSDLVEREVRI